MRFSPAARTHTPSVVAGSQTELKKKTGSKHACCMKCLAAERDFKLRWREAGPLNLVSEHFKFINIVQENFLHITIFISIIKVNV